MFIKLYYKDPAQDLGVKIDYREVGKVAEEWAWGNDVYETTEGHSLSLKGLKHIEVFVNQPKE